MKSEYKLFEVIVESSESKIFACAKQEWDVLGEQTSEDCTETCVCGQPKLKRCFTIYNNKTGNQLYPIGSECIKHFMRDGWKKYRDFLREERKVQKTLRAEIEDCEKQIERLGAIEFKHPRGLQYNEERIEYIYSKDIGYIEFVTKNARNPAYIGLIKYAQLKNKLTELQSRVKEVPN